MLRSCEWYGDKAKAWDVRVLEANTSLPEELKLAILGSRRRILFVEGSLGSLDRPLYNVLFPGLSVVPKESCVGVLRAVSGLRGSQDLHHVEAFGLVDRDDRTEDDVENLAKKGVFALRVHSAEALYYCSAAIAAVAHRQAESLGQDVEALLSSASQQAIDALKQDDLAERMAARRCERRIRELILSQIPGWKSIKDETARKVNVSVDSPYPKEFTRFKNLVDNGDLDQLLALYPLRESGALDVIAKALQCGSRSNYEQIVLSRIRANEDLAQHLKIRIGALSEALHELPQHAAPI